MLEGEEAVVGLAALAHGDPGVGVDCVGALGGGEVGGDRECLVGAGGGVAGGGEDVARGLEAGRGDDGHVHAGGCGGEEEGVADVVAVADVGEACAVEGADVLADGEQIGEGLAGVLAVGEGIDDWDACVLGELFEDGVVEDAGDDAVDPALQVEGVVADGLALADALGGVLEVHAGGAEPAHADLEADAGSE